MACDCAKCTHLAALQEQLRKNAERADEIREQRATGRRTLPSAAWALRWWANTRLAWGAPKGMPLDPEREGTGAPNRGADDPKRRAFAAVAFAVKVAQDDDRERHPTRPAPLDRWLAEHFGGGRAYHWIAEGAGWGEAEVSSRVERALRVVRDRLRERGWLDA